MRDADVSILNQLLYLNDSKGNLRHFFKKALTPVLITFVLSPLACQNHDLQKVSLGGCEVFFFFLQLNSRIISV